MEINKAQWPQEIIDFIENAKMTDTSGFSGAKTLFINKDDGFYLKIWERGKLKKDFLTLDYFSKLNMAPKPILFIEGKEFDYLITEKSPGKTALDPFFLNDPEKLVRALGKILRNFHDQLIDCPLRNSKEEMLERVENNYQRRNCDERMMEYLDEKNIDLIYQYIQENKDLLKDDTLLHGDYCLPNILLDDQWNLTHFLDLNMAGLGDRHYDIHWGIWSIWFNLNTKKYEDLFLDSYGRDAIDLKRLKIMSYISCLDE